MSKPNASDHAVIASATALPAIGDGSKQRIRLVPLGEFGGRDGRGPWRLRDKAHAEHVIAATKSFLAGVDMLINYDHQSEWAANAKVGGQAKAAGWIDPDTLEVGEDGIYGETEWTDPARSALAAREYRYYSPHFRADKKTGDLTRLVNVGLTNSPNIDVSALASQEAGASSAKGTLMPIAKLLSATALTALGLTTESEDEAAINAIDKLVSDAEGSEGVLASVRTRLELTPRADEDTILNAIDDNAGSGKPDPAKFVPVAALKDVQEQLGALQEDKVLACVDSAIEDGKITPALKDWAIELGKKDLSQLQSYLDKAVPFEGGSQKPLDKKPDADATKLTEDEAAVCASMGWSEEEFLAQKKEENA